MTARAGGPICTSVVALPNRKAASHFSWQRSGRYLCTTMPMLTSWLVPVAAGVQSAPKL